MGTSCQYESLKELPRKMIFPMLTFKNYIAAIAIGRIASSEIYLMRASLSLAIYYLKQNTYANSGLRLLLA
jgi:hypothetical protein